MKNIDKILILVLLNLVVLNSCCIDTKHRGFVIWNCTNDTLLFDLSTSETIDDDIYWGIHPEDTFRIFPEDTISVYVKGKKTTFLNHYYAIPDTFAGRIYPFPKSTCYLYAIKWRVATRYSFDEIRAKKLYDRRVVTKKDFQDHIYEYRYRTQQKTINQRLTKYRNNMRQDSAWRRDSINWVIRVMTE